MPTTITIQVEGAVLTEQLQELLPLLTEDDKREVVKQTLVTLLKGKLERELFPNSYRHGGYPRDTQQFLEGLTAAAGKAMAAEVANDEVLQAVVSTARDAVKQNMTDIALKAVTAHLFQTLQTDKINTETALSQSGFTHTLVEDLRTRLGG